MAVGEFTDVDLPGQRASPDVEGPEVLQGLVEALEEESGEGVAGHFGLHELEEGRVQGRGRLDQGAVVLGESLEFQRDVPVVGDVETLGETIEMDLFDQVDELGEEGVDGLQAGVHGQHLAVHHGVVIQVG